MHKERKALAKAEIGRFLLLARKIYEVNPCLSRLYVHYAFYLVKRTKVRLSREEKRLFCRKCFTPWIEGKTLKVEGRNYICLNCGYKRKL